MQTCSTCKFWLDSGAGQGLCRRLPPVPLPTPEGLVISHFPVLLPEGWCGEWKIAPRKETAQ